jgi:hypothetical protein
LSKSWWIGLCLVLVETVAGVGCGDGDTGKEAPAPSGPTTAEQELIGTWTTTTVDQDQAEVEFVLTLEEGGRLSMAEKSSAGGQLSFPGTWALEDGLLVLRGVYFEPDGEIRVKYSLPDGDTLVLEDETGAQGVWTRR